MSTTAKTAQGRRELNFNSLDDVIADMEKVVGSPDTKMLGKMPLNHLIAHLTTAVNSSFDGFTVKAPWIFRIVGPFLKGRAINNKMSPGFKLPGSMQSGLFPSGPSEQEALEQFRQAAARSKNERMMARHPILGQLNHEEWMRLHLRHSELHLSFAVPE